MLGRANHLGVQSATQANSASYPQRHHGMENEYWPVRWCVASEYKDRRRTLHCGCTCRCDRLLTHASEMSPLQNPIQKSCSLSKLFQRTPITAHCTSVYLSQRMLLVKLVEIYEDDDEVSTNEQLLFIEKKKKNKIKQLSLCNTTQRNSKSIDRLSYI